VLDAALELDETRVHEWPVTALFGASSPTALGTATSTCTDWTDPNTPPPQYGIDAARLINTFPSLGGGSVCSGRLLCAQLKS
jgi:hypothetical protein